MNGNFTRSLNLPPAGADTFFLWGPRQSGKSTLLRTTYPDAAWVDLLKTEEYRRYLAQPELLRQELEAQLLIGSAPRQVIIDEVQKVPALLDEVHWLIENRGVSFALCGSSARKVKRGAANLLGGRALRYALYGLSGSELTDDFDLERILNHGYLPRIYQAKRAEPLLRAYVADYLKEEVAFEGLARNLPVFSDFLDMAALGDGELINFANIARECSVSSHTVKNYFQILEETLLGSWLHGYTKQAKRRVIAAPKFYFADVGVVNQLARRGQVIRGSASFGKAFENWVFHELKTYLEYRQKRQYALSYWRLASGVEVDFIVGDMQLAIEAKSSARITSKQLRGLRHLVNDHPQVKRRVIVALEPKARLTEDGIYILPAELFLQSLWQDGLGVL